MNNMFVIVRPHTGLVVSMSVRDNAVLSVTGIPVRNFDTVSVDSDLDSVCTDQVRQHLCRRAGKRYDRRWKKDNVTSSIKSVCQLG